MIKLRKIRLKILGWQGIIYRLFIILCNTIFFWILTGEFRIAITISIGWNIINMCLYYLYHYFFARAFKLGRNYNDFTGM